MRAVIYNDWLGKPQIFLHKETVALRADVMLNNRRFGFLDITWKTKGEFLDFADEVAKAAEQIRKKEKADAGKG